MTIKTLSEILAEMGESPVSVGLNNKKTIQKPSCKQTSNQPTTDKIPSHLPPKPNTITQPIAKLPYDDKLAAVLADVDAEPWADNSKENRYLRWLAFYYLARREHSQYELGKKLIAKGCDETAVGLLLDEFTDKGYQSDERFAYMVIREHLRKGRGKTAIKLALNQAKIKLLDIDKLIDEAITQSAGDGTIIEQDQGADWLKLAIDARCKKYGNSLPTTAKDKARQLRFLQYRGFELGICFDALKYTPDSYQDEFG